MRYRTRCRCQMLSTCCTCRRIFIRGAGCINVPGEYLTYVTEHVAVVNMLHMPSYIHQGGWEGVLTFLTTCNKDYPHKRFKMAQVNKKYYKTYHFRGRLRGKSHGTIVAGTRHKDGTWKHVKKWRPMSMLHKKNQQVYEKKVLLGLQLDMAS